MAARLPNNLGSARSTDPSRVGFLPGGRDTGAGPVVCAWIEAALNDFSARLARMRPSLLRGEPTGSGGTPGVGGLPGEMSPYDTTVVSLRSRRRAWFR